MHKSSQASKEYGSTKVAQGKLTHTMHRFQGRFSSLVSPQEWELYHINIRLGLRITEERCHALRRGHVTTHGHITCSCCLVAFSDSFCTAEAHDAGGTH